MKPCKKCKYSAVCTGAHFDEVLRVLFIQLRERLGVKGPKLSKKNARAYVRKELRELQKLLPAACPEMIPGTRLPLKVQTAGGEYERFEIIVEPL